MYSVDALLDADVYDADGKEIGEVEDILLSDDMSIHSLVIETGSLLGLGGREVVAERGTFTVRVEQEKDRESFDDIDYEVHMEATQDAVKELPEYNEGWWNKTKEATSSAWHNVREGAESMGDKAKEATNNN